MTGQRTSIQLDAPAKINLYLRVLGRRADGYHELDSLFVPLALADRVEVAYTPGPLRPSDPPNPAAGVTCVCPDHPTLEGERNLATRAARAYLEAAGLNGAQVELTVHKRIWIAAGLGGGSSDAAAVLLALNRLAPALTRRRFQALARDLGADVPFFLAPRPALARGIGDELADLPLQLPELHLVLVNPGLPLKTAAVFEGLHLEPGEDRGPMALPTALDLQGLSALIHNDLEPVAAGLRPEITQMRQTLEALGALGTGMSGSGPTVFGLFPAPQLAASAAHKILDTTGFLAAATGVLAA